jgi:GTPase SAR1 family protein
LIGNKSDPWGQRNVSYQEGADLAKEYDIRFFEISTKDDDNLEKAFLALATETKYRVENPSEAEKSWKEAKDEQEKLENDERTAAKKLENEKSIKEALSQGTKEWRRSKIMIVGEGRAGKTALANSILGRPYKDQDSTNGINEFSCNIGYASSIDHKNIWSELQNQKNVKEVETAVARMIFDQKSGKTANKKSEDQFEEDSKRPNGGYLHETSTASQRVQISKEIIQSPQDVSKDRSSVGIFRRLFGRKTKPKEPSEVTDVKPPIETDSSVVMKYLGERAKMNSKFTISVFDFGGQSVFNVIHPFFLTRLGVYVITFNMEWLVSSADPAIQEECIRYMSFWLNSVIIHTQNEKDEIAPVVFVGTKKDLITSPVEHQAISTCLYNLFCNSLAWSYVIENNGEPDLHFFPVNNKLGNQDSTVQKLLQLIDNSIDESSYVHVERPLSWFKVLDIFKSKNDPYLEYSEVESVVVSCKIAKDEVPTLLTFFHEMGILMWHDEDTLRDTIVFDPIECFVKPATLIVCKHVPNQSDGVHHSTKLHEEARKLFPVEFSEMTQYGIVAESILVALLKEYSGSYQHVKQLMIKYGLLVPLFFSTVEVSEMQGVNSSQTGNNEELYLAPSLLPESNDFHHLVNTANHNSFSFIFATAKYLKQKSAITLLDCHKLGFLPSGLFENLISKAIGWSMITSNYVSRDNLYHCFKNRAELAFGNQRFLMKADYHHNLITVTLLEGNNPLAVHDRLKDLIHAVIQESFKSLNFISALQYSCQEEPEKKDDPNCLSSLITLNQLRHLMEQKSSLLLRISERNCTLAFADAMQLYGPWLTDFIPPSDYDIFFSYRWGRYDSSFTQGLFDRLSLHSVDPSMRRIRIFIDTKRLQTGKDFQINLVEALSKSLLFVPIVSADALQRMVVLKSTDEDNLLLEWICGLELVKHRQSKVKGSSSRVMKIMPIFFGSRTDETHSKNLFQEDIISRLPTVQPIACLKIAKHLLSQVGVKMSSETSRATVKEIVVKVTKYLFLCAWESRNTHQLTSLAANKIVADLNDCMRAEQEPQASIQKTPSDDSNVDNKILSSARATVDYQVAWDLLRNPARSTDFSTLSELLESNGVLSANDLAFISDDPELFENVVKLLKNIPQRQFRALFSTKEA